MAKVVNTFVKGKLNKDLDARLVPNGEYRDARNVQVSKSEGPDVGELENVLGNEITSLTWGGGIKCIGWVTDEAKSFVYLFLTDNAGEPYDSTATNRIVQYNVNTNTSIDLLFTGTSKFLNFSQLYPIFGVNIIDNLLFWTDNRNQPRKINIERAVADPRYYQTEDQISVAKYSPYQPFQLWQESTLSSNSYPDNYETTMKNVTELFLPGGGSCQTDGLYTGVAPNNKIKNLSGVFKQNQNIFELLDTGEIIDTGSNVDITVATAGLTQAAGGAVGTNTFTSTLLPIFPPSPGMQVTSVNGVSVSTGTTPVPIGTTVVSYIGTTCTLDKNFGDPVSSGAGLGAGDSLTFSGTRDPNEVNAIPPISSPPASASPLPDNTTLIFGTPNPYYNGNFSGDPAFLDDKFVRFSYRFRYDDNEYSIFAPFTQPAFIPKQDGYFQYTVGGFPSLVRDDQADAYRSTIVEFMENKVEDITLVLPLPFNKFILQDSLKLKEIDILYKESDGLAVRVIDTIPIEEIRNSSGRAQVSPAVAGSNQITLNAATVVGTINIGDIITSKSITSQITVVSYDEATATITASGAVTIPQSEYIYIGDQYTYTYNYVSKKPIKTLPEGDLTRVFDKIPVKAFSQEISGNRVIYGNYLNKHTPPEFIDYNVTVGDKSEFEIREGTAQVDGNQTLTAGSLDLTVKNWTPSPGVTDIEVGDDILDSSGTFLAKVQAVNAANTLVTFDRVPFGLTNPAVFVDNQVLTFTDPGTVNQRTSKVEYPNHSLKQNRNYQVGIVLSDRFGRQSSVILSNNKEAKQAEGSTFIGDTIYSAYISQGANKLQFPGESLKVLFNNPIGPTANSNFAWPGIYNGDATSDDYNPLGWYSYKIVVKQTEQEYYNVYLPGIMASYPEDQTLELDSSSHVVLINDNINKVPRDLTEVGPDQKQYRSSVRLFGRVQNTNASISYDLITGTTRTESDNIGLANEQYYPGRIADTVSTISTMFNLFEYDPLSPPQPNFYPQFYQFDSNPLIARITTQNEIGQVAETDYFPASAVVPSDQSNVGPGGNPVKISSVSGTPVPGMLVQGIGIPENTYIDSYTLNAGADDDLTLVKIDGATAQQVTVDQGDVLYFVPAQDIAGAFPLTVPGIQYLSIYETEPVISNLDIFWETTTTGLIQDLNDFILNETSGGSGVGPLNASGFDEGIALGADVFNTDFKVNDQFGIALNPADFTTIDVQLISVVDGNNPGNDVTDYFQLDGTDQTTGWNVETTANFYSSVFYGNDAQARIFVFTFEVTTLSNAVGAQTTTVQQQVTVPLQNVAPTITPGDTTITTNRGVTGSIQNITAVNGANNAALQANDLSIEIYDILQDGTSLAAAGADLDDFFVLTPSTVVANQLTTDLEFANPAPPIANYVIRVRAVDAGLDDEADYSVSLNQVGAVENEEIIPIIRQEQQNVTGFTGSDIYCTIPHIKIRIDASTIPGQNGYYLFTGPMGGTFNQLKSYVSDPNVITIDRTNAYDIDASGPPGIGYNCGSPNSNTFLYSSVDFATVLSAANSGGCNEALDCDDCPSPSSEVWEDQSPIDISNFDVEII